MSIAIYPYADFQVPWSKPYCRGNMSKVRMTKDLLFLVCLVSMACPQFGSHRLPPLNINRFDNHARFDPVAIIGKGTRSVHLAKPCSPVRSGSPSSVKRTIRFVVLTSEDIEEVIVDTPFKDY
eukprot:4280622-Heterocapsa_arctica.AAC.1